jgi:hypothetical protein
MFKTSDVEVVARLRDAYYPALVRVTRFKDGQISLLTPTNAGKRSPSLCRPSVRSARARGVDADRYFAKKREEHAEALAAR